MHAESEPRCGICHLQWRWRHTGHLHQEGGCVLCRDARRWGGEYVWREVLVWVLERRAGVLDEYLARSPKWVLVLVVVA